MPLLLSLLALLSFAGLAAPQSTAISQCDRPVDIVFVVDESGSICQNHPGSPPQSPPLSGSPPRVNCGDWNRMRTFVSNISALFPMGPKNIVTSYISFSNDAPMLNYLPLNASLSGEGFAGKVRNFLMNSGGTATWAGLREAQAEFALNGRDAADGAAQMVIVLTDGLSQIPAQTAAKAAELRASGVLVAAVGVGPIMGPQGGAACGPLGPASGCNTAVCSAQQCNARQEVFNLAARSDLVWANQWTDLTPESPILVSLLNAAYLAPIIPPAGG